MQPATIQSKIFEIRGQKIMIDADLAEMYEVPTKAFKQSVKRNLERFPADFMFELTLKEFNALRSQSVTSKRGGTRYRPYAFTEQGVAMLSSILGSKKAIDINILIIRTFVLMRQSADNYKELANKIAALETTYDKQFGNIHEVLDVLIAEQKKQETMENRALIGFKQK